MFFSPNWLTQMFVCKNVSTLESTQYFVFLIIVTYYDVVKLGNTQKTQFKITLTEILQNNWFNQLD